MNILAIDHGSKRIGLAIGSTEGGVAAPLQVVQNKSEKALIADLNAIIASEAIDQVVIGLPIAEDGGHSEQEGVVREFYERMADALDTPVLLEDERLSSREIESHMQAMGGKKAWKQSGLDRDTAAATLFLQTYLDKLKLTE